MENCEHDFVKIFITNKYGGGWRKICKLCEKIFPLELDSKISDNTYFVEVKKPEY